MSIKRLSTLDALTGAASAAVDLFLVEDVSVGAGKLKSMTRAQVVAAIETQLGYSLGNVASYLPLAGGTLVGDLKFTDATYDIGKSGATRPRHIFASGNAVIGGGFTLAAGAGVDWLGRTSMSSTSDGVLRLTNNAGTDFSRIVFGGTTSSFSAIKRAGAGLEIKLADDSAYALLAASSMKSQRDHYAGSDGSSSNLGFWTLGYITSRSDGVWSLLNNAGTGFGRLQFGGTTSSFPSIKRNGAIIDLRLADDSAYADLNAAVIQGLSGIYAGSATGIAWSSRSFMSSPSDGIIQLTNAAQTDFARLQFGGSTSSFPSLRRNGSTLDVVLADSSGFAPISASGLYINDNTHILRSLVSMANNAGALTGTLANSPKTGDPTKWLSFNDNGTIRYIPAW